MSFDLGMDFLKLSDKTEIESLLAERKHRGCEANFATLYMWSAAYGTKIARGFGCVAPFNPKLGVLHFPIGKFPPPENLEKFYEAFETRKLLKYHFFYDTPKAYLESLPEAEKFFRQTSEPAEFDYLYSVEKLLEMRGGKLRKKRNLVRQFEDSRPDFRTEKISPSNMEGAKNFMLNSPEVRHFPDENAAIQRAFENFFELGLEGILLYPDTNSNAPIGAAILNRLDADEWSVAFEKSVHSERGASQELVLAESRAIADLGGKLMNREQDLGEENLRHAKESLDPLLKYERIRLSPIKPFGENRPSEKGVAAIPYSM